MQLAQQLAATAHDPASHTPHSPHAVPAGEAILVLADGCRFSGRSIGAPGLAVGEAVFNTSMTGYQEILTDPSYRQQLVCLTYPHIGSTGWTSEDNESRGVQAAGLIIRSLPPVVSNFRSQQSLPEALLASGAVAIADVDTRALTRILREGGAQSAAILALSPGESLTDAHVQQAQQAAQAFGGLVGLDLAREVTTDSVYGWTEGSWVLGGGHPTPEAASQRFHVVAYDLGVKHNILRLLVDRGCRVTVVPAQTPYDEALALQPDGIFLSNGPGDPEPCTYAIEVARRAMADRLPLFGICLGHQILALAAGARTLKMKFGHHGGNHPVKDLRSGRVAITAQNHGFAVDAESLPDSLEVTHVSLFDGSVQGLAHRTAPAFCFQGHPEASPGPHDVQPLFDQFIRLMSDSSPANA